MNTKKNPPDNNLKKYRTFGMPLLIFMGLLALTGIIVAVLVHFLF